MEEDQERLNQLRARLNEIHEWPSVFMFKFVLPNEEAKLEQLRQIFSESAEFKSRLSSKGNYISMTIREMMLDADDIFDRYRAASSIENIISL